MAYVTYGVRYGARHGARFVAASRDVRRDVRTRGFPIYKFDTGIFKEAIGLALVRPLKKRHSSSLWPFHNFFCAVC